jgi:hypothetical protein
MLKPRAGEINGEESIKHQTGIFIEKRKFNKFRL